MEFEIYQSVLGFGHQEKAPRAVIKAKYTEAKAKFASTYSLKRDQLRYLKASPKPQRRGSRAHMKYTGAWSKETLQAMETVKTDQAWDIELKLVSLFPIRVALDKICVLIQVLD